MTNGKQAEQENTGPEIPESDRWSVATTRGAGCWELAQILATGETHVAHSDLREACITARADLLVQRRLTSFDLVSIAVPHHFHRETVSSVIAAVGGGPHSLLAARVARKIARVLATDAAIVTVSRSRDDDTAAEEALDQIRDQIPGLTASVVRARSAQALVATLKPDTLLVIGAPGGSWVQRQLVGPGHQMRQVAPGGAIVVRSAEPRCFQRATPGLVVSPWLRVEDARRVMSDTAAVGVVTDGLLVGIVRRDALDSAPAGAEVATVIEEAVFVLLDDSLDAATDLQTFLQGAPVPVVDGSGRWFGSIFV